MTGAFRRWPGLLMSAYFALVVFFLLFPILIVIPISFVDAQFLTFPPESYSLRWYRRYFTDPDFVDATLLSLWVAFAATAVATVCGTLGALVLTRTRFSGKGAIYSLLLSPIIVPGIIFGLGLYVFFAELDLLGDSLALVMAHACLGLPFSILIVSATLEHFDVTLERAARVSGAGPIRTFFHVTLPAIRPAVFAAAVFGFFISFDDLVLALFVMGRQYTLPVRIWQDLRFEIDPTVAAAASLLILLTSIGIAAGGMLQLKARKRLEGTP
ncbi:MAG TPA: ABC transporter permease [Hypericibacter adhaerens]|jgi:putative spermidine/putrescine transport system permease protein|uniref:ABC transporter permease n=1 Tax=Hypericibacter adhaerens TaxID=2602016 RepID=UPI002CC84F86|nr:ABC transporter permease [Hypericibacter adhaerens]HWA45012.1 ABC transporter permease [Hypericibacter adhaerens]